MTFKSSASRREFLRRAGALAGYGAAAPWALNLAATAAASAQTASDDYKALVCVFMYGGNDHYNSIVPIDASSYAAYQAVRTNIALPSASLTGTEIVPDNPWTNGRRMALNPALAPLKTLFDQGHLALAMNVGTLTRQGVTLADYKGGIDMPPKLFSHNDQQSLWQSSLAEGATSGWGGRMADLLAAGNGAGATFTSISAGGNAVFMSGNDVVQYQVSGSGSTQVSTVFGSALATEAVKRLMQRSSSHLFEEEHAVIARRSIANDVQVRAALVGVADAAFPATGLGTQLKVVSRLIAARAALGVKRQVFFVSLGGFDLHDNLIESHPGLLSTVADAMSAFYSSTVAMGLADKITTFTGSDFGRTLANNGDGSDHGWGSYHYVMGGAVKPRTWVGSLPGMSVSEGPDNVGGGRMLPSIGVDQLGYTLAKWMGVSDANMSTVLPNIGNYSARDLGFMVST